MPGFLLCDGRKFCNVLVTCAFQQTPLTTTGKPSEVWHGEETQHLSGGLQGGRPDTEHYPCQSACRRWRDWRLASLDCDPLH